MQRPFSYPCALLQRGISPGSDRPTELEEAHRMSLSVTSPPPTLVFLHFLGGSVETWKRVEQQLQDHHACLRLDLPGFGGKAESAGGSVGAMADEVAAQVAEAGIAHWVLVGHSMGAKVALLLARRAEDGAPSLAGLCGLVLVAGSPPTPEPMSDQKRQDMLGWFEGDEDSSRAQADSFIRANVVAPLDEAAHDSAVDDVLRASTQAWRTWLNQGSRENLADEVGVLHLPTLVLSGGEDEALGPEAQTRLMTPHLAHARFEIIDGAGHLLPLEAPERVAGLIVRHLEAIAQGPTADRMTTRTREALRDRATQDDPAYRPLALSQGSLAVLRAVVAQIIPQRGTHIDLAARIDTMLHGAQGDGWRFAALPPDAEAYRAALLTLDRMAEAAHGSGFAVIDTSDQAALLRVVAASPGAEPSEQLAAPPDEGLDGPAMTRWFEEVRADAVRLFMTHPATLAALQCDAPATGGDEALTGFPPYRAGDAGRAAA